MLAKNPLPFRSNKSAVGAAIYIQYRQTALSLFQLRVRFPVCLKYLAGHVKSMKFYSAQENFLDIVIFSPVVNSGG